MTIPPPESRTAARPGAGGPAAFSNTRWSIVLRAGQGGDSADKTRALESLCRTYWPPLYAWLRSSGHTSEDAEDLVQSLFHDLLTKDSLATLSEGGGRFRSFLMTSLKNIAVDEYRKRGAAKRGGGSVFVSLDIEQGELLVKAADQKQSPDTAFDRNWAHTVLGAATADLRDSYIAAGREALFTALRPSLFGSGEVRSYDQLAEELGMSRGAVAMSVKRMRERFGELITQRVAETVADASEVREEMRYLLSLFACT